MTNISSFRDVHAGGIGLIVGNGQNLKLTPPECFNYPSIGMNTIHLYEGWKPAYYVTVDRRVMQEFGKAVLEKFADIPKFVPAPKLNKWKGDNFYRFPQRPGLAGPGNQVWQHVNDIGRAGMSYVNVMHVAIKLAYYMGFTTVLIIGMEHKPHAAQEHFWGHDAGIKSKDANLPEIYAGYMKLCTGLAAHNVRLINISEGTYVPDKIIPRDDWREWQNN